MPKYSAQFKKKLDSLFSKRSHWLQTVVWANRRGKPPKFDRPTVNRGVIDLQRLAEDALAKKYWRTELSNHVEEKRKWHKKGRGREEQKNNFKKWFDEKFGSKNCIYIFQDSRGKCVYVGRTIVGGSRPAGHFEKYWFSKVRRIDVYSVKSYSQVPKIECLAIHLFEPQENKISATNPKWTKNCPLCEKKYYIKTELHSIFRLK